MEQVDHCRREDISTVAGLHAKIFHGNNAPPSEQLKSYYTEVFFHNPWYDEELPSLVYRCEKGKVTGFIGVIPRLMSVNGNTVKVAVAHRLMVDPQGGTPLAAVKLVKRFFSGPQDLSLADGANDLGRKFWEGMGGSTAYVYSMNWIRPLKPCRYAMSLLKKNKYLRPLAVVSWPAGCLADALLSTIRSSPFHLKRPKNHTAVEIDCQLLLRCVMELSQDSHLRPVYNMETMQWLWNFLKSNKHRGRFEGAAVYDTNSSLAGIYLYYLNSRGICEVMLLNARNDCRDDLLRHLLTAASNQQAVCVSGRFEPKFTQSFWIEQCLIKRGSWALIHAKDARLLNIINRGDAHISPLEGELWLRSPRDIL